MVFDVRTCLVLLLVSNSVSLFLLLFPLAQKRGSMSGERLLALSKVVQSLAWLAFLYQNVLPDYISIHIAGLSLYSGLAIEAIAISTVQRGRIENRYYEYILYTSAILAVIWLFPMGGVSLLWKVTVSSSLVSVYFSIVCIRLMFQNEVFPLTRIFAFVYFVNATLLFIKSSRIHEVDNVNIYSTVEVYDMSFLVLFAASQLGVFGFILIKKEQAEQAIANLAMTDSLTGIYNRKSFDDRSIEHISIACRKRLLCALLLYDIDHFKKINDSFGHPAGDKVIKSFADILKKTVRDYDCVGRCGGEEFGVFLVDISLEDALMVAERIRIRAERDCIIGLEQIQYTVSGGMSHFVPSKNSREIFANCYALSDKALYASKESGRNRIFVNRTPLELKQVSKVE
ncbi:MAG: GGDEF domain-containing protein [Acidobacteriota bacterium]